jgi:hypothetical protein
MPGEERDIDDDEQADRLLLNPLFTQVKQTKAPPKPGEVPPTTDTEQQPPAEAEGEGS